MNKYDYPCLCGAVEHAAHCPRFPEYQRWYERPLRWDGKVTVLPPAPDELLPDYGWLKWRHIHQREGT